MIAVKINNLSKKFKLYHERVSTLKEILLFRKNRYEDFWALKDINLEIKKGESIGIIGANGSGKTTLLKLMANILQPTTGMIEINERMSALLELGIGFHDDLTGRENIYLYASILGIPKKEIDKKFDDIVSFAEIEQFIDTPIKNYSSGMRVRLGFATAINVDPDILLIDEVLAVGDASFQRKCYEKMNEFKKKNKTIILVSHDLNAVNAICDKVFLLENGKIIKHGEPDKVISHYMLSIGDEKGIADIKSGELEVIFNNGKFFLLWRGKELTKYPGGISFILSDTWHDSTSADWEVKKVDNTEIIATGIWWRLPLIHIWRLKINDENDLFWSIEMEVEREVKIRQYHTNLLLLDKYKEWFTSHESGYFPDIKPGGAQWIYLSNKVTNEAISVKKYQTDSEELPSVMMKLEENENCIDAVLNSHQAMNARVLQRLMINSSQEGTYKPGNYKYFEGIIQIGK